MRNWFLNFYSIILMTVVDVDYKFVYLDIGAQ